MGINDKKIDILGYANDFAMIVDNKKKNLEKLLKIWIKIPRKIEYKNRSTKNKNTLIRRRINNTRVIIHIDDNR